MQLIPWRVKNFVSEHFPLLYHLAANAGAPGNSAAYWDRRLAQTWDSPERHWPTKNALIASLTKPTDSILDIGCGNGALLRHLQRLGYRRLHGLEASAYAVERLSKAGIEMHYGRLPAIGLPEASFDVVVASQVLEHIFRRHRLVSEMRRVLKPRGRAFIFVPDDCLGPISEPEHVIKYNKATLHALLARHFMVVDLKRMRDANHPMPLLFAQLEKAAG